MEQTNFSKKFLEDNNNISYKILFVCSIIEGEIVDIIPIEKITGLLKDCKFKLSLKIRFHPNTPKSLVKQNLKRIKKSQIQNPNLDISISKNNDLFLNDLKWCSHLITYYSTCCIEAKKQ